MFDSSICIDLIKKKQVANDIKPSINLQMKYILTKDVFVIKPHYFCQVLVLVVYQYNVC